MKLAKTSLVLLVIQLAIVSSIAAKYLYQRWSCPRVWARAVAYDPELLMRGRYLSLQLRVDACGNDLQEGNNEAGGLHRAFYKAGASFPARLKVENNRLIAIGLPVEGEPNAQRIIAAPSGSSCDTLRLQQPVDFYITEHVVDPSRTKPGQELWVEVTVPPQGPPRPLQLALKQDGAWKPLAFQ